MKSKNYSDNHSVHEASRVAYYDIIRTAAIYMAIVIHVSMAWWGSSSVNSFEWVFANFFNSASRIGVPLLIMISGALIIRSNKPFNMQNKIGRIVKAYLFWSFLYAVEFVIFEEYSGKAFVEFIKQLVMGHYHLWFCYMIVGLYLMFPFVDAICASKKLTIYYLALWGIFSVCIPSLQQVPGMGKLSILTNKFSIFFPLGYMGYWVLGYWLKSITPGFIKGERAVLCVIVMIISFLVTFFGSYNMSRAEGIGNAVLFDNFMPNVVIGATCFFLLAQSIEKTKLNLKNIANNSFAVYLMSDFFVLILKHLIVSERMLFCTSILIPVYALIIMFLCSCITCAMREVPLLRNNII